MGHLPRPVNPEIRRLVNYARKAGWKVVMSRSGHWHVFPADETKPMIVMPSTPSDWRGALNSMAELTRAGLDLAPEAETKIKQGLEAEFAPPSNLQFDQRRFGRALFNWRRQNQLTQGELAELVEVSQMTISDWERGVRCPTMDRLYSIQKALGWADFYASAPSESNGHSNGNGHHEEQPAEAPEEPEPISVASVTVPEKHIPAYLRAMDGLADMMKENRQLNERNLALEEMVQMLTQELTATF